MELYFVVLHLPGGKRLRLKEGKGSETIMAQAVDAIGSGKAKVVSRRQDTGAAEEIRRHAGHANRFKTYILVNMHLSKNDGAESIFKKAARQLSNLRHTSTVIDTGHNYQLLTIEG